MSFRFFRPLVLSGLFCGSLPENRGAFGCCRRESQDSDSFQPQTPKLLVTICWESCGWTQSTPSRLAQLGLINPVFIAAHLSQVVRNSFRPPTIPLYNIYIYIYTVHIPAPPTTSWTVLGNLDTGTISCWGGGQLVFLYIYIHIRIYIYVYMYICICINVLTKLFPVCPGKLSHGW